MSSMGNKSGIYITNRGNDGHSVRDTNEVVLVAMQETMYMPTPSMALDQLVFHALQDHPEWGFTVVELAVTEDRKLVPIVNRMTERGWESKEFDSLQGVVDTYDPSVLGFSATSKHVKRLMDLVGNEVDAEDRMVIAGGPGISAGIKSVRKRFKDVADVLYDTGSNSAELFSRLLDNPSDLRILEAIAEDMDLRPGLNVPASHQRLADWDGKTVYRTQTASGCAHYCNFCAISNKFVPRSIDEVRDYLDSVVEDMKKKGLRKEDVLVFLEDGNFGGDDKTPARRRMKAHYEKVLKLFSDYDLNFGVQVRYDNLSDEYLAELRDGNVSYLFTSVESTNTRVLKKMHKAQTGNIKRIYERFQKIREMDFEYAISFIRGTEEDTMDTFMQTASFVRLLAPEYACMEVAKVYPGTVLSRRVRFEAEAKVHMGVTSIYSTGIHLVDNPLLGPENDGTFLLTTEKAALEAIRASEQLFCNGVGARDLGLVPLEGNYHYVMDRPGFFRKVVE